MSSSVSRFTVARFGFLTVVAVTMLGFLASAVDARSGRGFSFGSRGDRTYTAPPTTNTAPKTAAPIDKSMAQPGAAAKAPGGATAGSATAAQGASRFGGMRGLLMGGLFAAALAGIFGVGMLASVLGFLLQTVLIAAVVYLLWSFFTRARSTQPQPAMAGASASPGRRPGDRTERHAAHAVGGGASPGLDLGPADFDAFEARLGAIQSAYGRGDLEALGKLVTPEMLSYFARELDDDRRKGVRNEVSGAKLLQGDLAEAWREASGEYATVAMRYSLIDAEVEAATGGVLSGSLTEPSEVTEVWTFRRPQGGKSADWELSAIQQAG